MSYKLGVYGERIGNTIENPATNSCVFATHDEAKRAGAELLSRWFGPDGHCVLVSDEPVNYRFPQGAARPEPIER